MPGITTLDSVVASGAGYASNALDPPPAVLAQLPQNQPASYDRHRASYSAESTRFSVNMSLQMAFLRQYAPADGSSPSQLSVFRKSHDQSFLRKEE